MSQVDNPERLWVTCASDGVAFVARDYSDERDARSYRESLRVCDNADAFTPVAEYIRADVAERQVAEAVKKAIEEERADAVEARLAVAERDRTPSEAVAHDFGGQHG